MIVVEPGLIDTMFGDVAVGPLLERSGEGAYAELARKVAEGTRNRYRPGHGTSPDKIGEVIAGAVGSRRPKTRYVAGKYARSLILLRKWLGDRVFDRVIANQV